MRIFWSLERAHCDTSTRHCLESIFFDDSEIRFKGRFDLLSHMLIHQSYIVNEWSIPFFFFHKILFLSVDQLITEFIQKLLYFSHLAHFTSFIAHSHFKISVVVGRSGCIVLCLILIISLMGRPFSWINRLRRLSGVVDQEMIPLSFEVVMSVGRVQSLIYFNRMHPLRVLIHSRRDIVACLPHQRWLYNSPMPR